MLVLGKIRMPQKVENEITKLRPDSGYKRIAILDDEKDVTITFRTILDQISFRMAK